jgi:hypothetical protein
MDPFFMYVAIGALVVLTLMLILIGVSMAKVQSLDAFPPTKNACPDYWDVSSNPQYCGIPTNHSMRNWGYTVVADGVNNNGVTYKKIDTSNKQNVGLCNASNTFGCKTTGSYLNLQPEAASDYQYVQLNNNPSWGTMYPGLSETCAKKRWATTMNLTWDGVTNFNGC